MKIHNLLRPFWRRRRHAPIERSPASTHRLRATLTMVAQTQEQELSCDEAYAFLDTYADRVNCGEDVAALMPLVHHHLAMCPDCREEFDALLRSIEPPGVRLTRKERS